MSGRWGFTFNDLETEAYSLESIGYCWTTVIEEAVKSTLKSRKYPPDGWGYPGYGPTGLEWGSDAIEEITDWIVEAKFKTKKEHLAALAKNIDGTVDGVYGLILRTVAWAIQDRRKNSVDGNAVRLIKEILKTEYGVVLKASISEADMSYQSTVDALTQEMKKVPQNWNHVAEMTKRGTPRKNLPVVFKKQDLRDICSVIAAMDPLPASNQIWKSIQSVLPIREGTQAGNRANSGRETTVADGSFWAQDAENKMSSNQNEANEEISSEGSLEGPIQAFRTRISGKGEAALVIGLHPDFATLPLSSKLEAVQVESEAELRTIFTELSSLSVEIAREFDLDQVDIDTVISLTGRALLSEREVW